MGRYGVENELGMTCRVCGILDTRPGEEVFDPDRYDLEWVHDSVPRRGRRAARRPLVAAALVSPRELRPGDGQGVAYERDGWWLSPVLFDARRDRALPGATARVVAGDAPRRSGAGAVPAARARLRTTCARSTTPGGPTPTWPRSPPIRGSARSRPRCSAPSVRLWQDQLLYKPPGGPAETTIGWHQDWASWDTVASHAAFVTAWVAFDDVDDDNGAMQMIPGSHHWGLVARRRATSSDRPRRPARTPRRRAAVEPRSIVMRAGQVSFHHPLTFHGSGPNTSDRMRRSLAIHFVDAEVCAVSDAGIWQHYNLALFLERGGLLGEPYRFDDLCSLVHPPT